MNQGTLAKIVALGAMTGMRSMAGLATLARAYRGPARSMISLAAAGEMIADKTSMIGARTDPLPLAARAIIGAAVGARIAVEQEENGLLGALLGAATAVSAAYLAHLARTRLPVPRVAGGVLEDSMVIAIASRYA